MTNFVRKKKTKPCFSGHSPPPPPKGPCHINKTTRSKFATAIVKRYSLRHDSAGWEVLVCPKEKSSKSPSWKAEKNSGSRKMQAPSCFSMEGFCGLFSREKFQICLKLPGGGEDYLFLKCSVPKPKGPCRTKNSTALDSVVFCYRRSFLLTVPFSCLLFLEKQALLSTLRTVLLLP